MPSKWEVRKIFALALRRITTDRAIDLIIASDDSDGTAVVLPVTTRTGMWMRTWSCSWLWWSVDRGFHVLPYLDMLTWQYMAIFCHFDGVPRKNVHILSEKKGMSIQKFFRLSVLLSGQSQKCQFCRQIFRTVKDIIYIMTQSREMMQQNPPERNVCYTNDEWNKLLKLAILVVWRRLYNEIRISWNGKSKGKN